MRTAVVMTVCDRPDYLRQALESWLQVDGVGWVDWWFMLEPTEQQGACWTLVSQFCRALDRDTWRDLFLHGGAGSRTIWPNERRLGVLENPYQGLKLAFNSGAEYVVLAEDDVLVSRDVLAYHAWAAQEFAPWNRQTPPPLAVCSHQMEQRGDEYGVLRSGKFDPLVWGTWAEAWREVIEPTWDHDYSSGPGGGQQAGWDWNINRQLTERGLTVVKPAQSRSQHIGEHGGTHCTPDLYPATVSRCFTAEREPGDYCLIDALIGDQ